ncbi:competence protein ComEA [Pseudomonas fluorescens]|uniref:ComEA family DNA-binding protein n=1 Tax=Pseudomonas TaxID=286 RepID=UPI00070FC491|nr:MULTISPECIES: helix-hairpin-helix domain-containing protein [Pseudomonas]OOQ43704.1 competence protein ComEA [Pseudomonas fluorescens]
MRKGYFYSLFFALLSGASVAAIAAPEAKAVESSMVTEAATRANTYKVDLNGADAQTLQRELIGVGEAKAKAIVAYRDNNGPFASVDELLEVKGIGKAILESNRDRIEVN